MNPARRAAAALALVLASVVAAGAQGYTFSEPAGVLVMPFDVTANHASFQIVSAIGPRTGETAVRTHWVFFAADCRHLADVTIFLTPNDTVVVDPQRLQGQIQQGDPPANVQTGTPVDLSGERGVVTVRAIVPGNASSSQLVGAWTIANAATPTSFGNDAIGLAGDGSLPDADILTDGGLHIPTFDPEALQDSEVILIGVESVGETFEPINRRDGELGGAHVCCATSFVDVLELAISAPDVCFRCVGFFPITADVAENGEAPLLVGLSATGPGYVHLTNCRTADADGTIVDLGDGEFEQFLFAFHGQTVGPFGAVVSGKYLTEDF